MSKSLRAAPLIPEPELARHFRVSADTLRSAGIEPTEVTPTKRKLFSMEAAERIGEQLARMAGRVAA